MIKLNTNCDDCIHKKVCKNINNAENNMNKLKKTQYGSGPSNDYDWDIMMHHYNVVIEFSCQDFEKTTITRNSIPGGREPLNFAGVKIPDDAWCNNCKHYSDGYENCNICVKQEYWEPQEIPGGRFA